MNDRESLRAQRSGAYARGVSARESERLHDHERPQLRAPRPEPSHDPGFCAENGEIWRLMTRDPHFGEAPIGRTATLEGTAFPQSGFLRANRVGY